MDKYNTINKNLTPFFLWTIKNVWELKVGNRAIIVVFIYYLISSFKVNNLPWNRNKNYILGFYCRAKKSRRHFLLPNVMPPVTCFIRHFTSHIAQNNVILNSLLFFCFFLGCAVAEGTHFYGWTLKHLIIGVCWCSTRMTLFHNILSSSLNWIFFYYINASRISAVNIRWVEKL